MQSFELSASQLLSGGAGGGLDFAGGEWGGEADVRLCCLFFPQNLGGTLYAFELD